MRLKSRSSLVNNETIKTEIVSMKSGHWIEKYWHKMSSGEKC